MPADILYVDDDPDALLGAAKRSGADARFSVAGIADLKAIERPLAGATAWVLDFYNDEGSREDPTFAGTESTGLSLFQRLRLLAGESRPPAILISNHLETALGQGVTAGLRHRLAEEVGVEWVADKSPETGAYVREILAIADATATFQAAAKVLAAAQPGDYVAALADNLLRLSTDAQWRPLAISDVDAWRPPVLRAASEGAGGERLDVNARPFVAWMIRQTLAYPSFVISIAQVAARLGVSTSSLRTCAAAENGLAKALGSLEYSGVLKDFVGKRWWSAGVDDFVFSLPGASDDRQGALEALAGKSELEFLNIDDPVVVSNADLVETDQIAPSEDCVRASDEHAPSHAPPAWVLKRDVARDRTLARRVWLEDQTTLAASA